MALNKVTDGQVDQAALAAQKIFKAVSKLPVKVAEVAEAATEGVKNVAAGFEKFKAVANKGMVGYFKNDAPKVQTRVEACANSICKEYSGKNIDTAGVVLKKVVLSALS